jgi:hypothetical protein
MDIVFQCTPYSMAVIVDLKSESEAFIYSVHNFVVVLHNLNPPPQVYNVGAAISESMANELIGVWEGYIKGRGTEDTLLINVSVEGAEVSEMMLI